MLKINDLMELNNRSTNEKFLMVIENLYKYTSFEEIYKHFGKTEMGYDREDKANPKDMEVYYSKEKQKKYGVLGIKVKK